MRLLGVEPSLPTLKWGDTVLGTKRYDHALVIQESLSKPVCPFGSPGWLAGRRGGAGSAGWGLGRTALAHYVSGYWGACTLGREPFLSPPPLPS